LAVSRSNLVKFLFGSLMSPLARLAVDLKKTHPQWPLTVFIRSTTVDEYFKSTAGADRIVHGSFSDKEQVRSLSKEHDIVINSASSFDGELINLIISGMEERPDGSKGTLIHLSGTGNFIDHGITGNFNPESKVWNVSFTGPFALDNEKTDANDRTPTRKILSSSTQACLTVPQTHRKMLNFVLLNILWLTTSVPRVLEAGNRGKIITYIICFAVTYGPNLGPSRNLGVGETILTSNAIAKGFVPYVGDGSAIVSTVGDGGIPRLIMKTDKHQVHVADAVPFISKIVGIAGTEEPQGTAYSRYYILHGERLTWKQLGLALAKALHARGLVASPEPKSVPVEEAGEGEVGKLIGANMLVQGDRAARLGFKATQPSMLIQLQEDLDAHKF